MSLIQEEKKMKKGGYSLSEVSTDVKKKLQCKMQSWDLAQSVGVLPMGTTLDCVPEQKDWTPFGADDCKMSVGSLWGAS